MIPFQKTISDIWIFPASWKREDFSVTADNRERSCTHFFYPYRKYGRYGLKYSSMNTNSKSLMRQCFTAVIEDCCFVWSGHIINLLKITALSASLLMPCVPAYEAEAPALNEQVCLPASMCRGSCCGQSEDWSLSFWTTISANRWAATGDTLPEGWSRSFITRHYIRWS